MVDASTSSTGRTHTVQRFLELAFEIGGVNYWDLVMQDPELMHPAEVEMLVGEPTKPKNQLGWEERLNWTNWFKLWLTQS